jgi:hypothetical protein
MLAGRLDILVMLAAWISWFIWLLRYVDRCGWLAMLSKLVAWLYWLAD